ncbi:MAG: hypothetical protein Q4B42_05110 [Oscillospiraceae bacterium]|nr:hypothetical protein [Oscillospiraceae bacterium]
MKKRKTTSLVIAAVFAVLLLAAAAFWLMPAGFNKIDAAEVERITIFSGQSGASCTVTDAADIARITENLSSCTLKPDGISLGYMGYSLRISFELSSGGETEFIINSADRVRKSPFFYDVTDGSIDYEYLQSLVNASNQPMGRQRMPRTAAAV